MNKSIGGVQNQIQIKLEIIPTRSSNQIQIKQFQPLRPSNLHIKVVNTGEYNLSALLKPWHLKWIKAGVLKALEYGPLLSFPVVGVEIALHEFQTTPNTIQPFIINAIQQCTFETLKQCTPILLEPLMKLEITTPEEYIGSVLSDLTTRRCEFNVDDNDNNNNNSQKNSNIVGDMRHLIIYVPLAELTNYSTVLRTITSGMASFDMHLHCYRLMNEYETNRAIRTVTGIDF